MTAIDSRRLARSLSLGVRRLSDGDGYEVSGGREPHVVRLLEDSWTCDCRDALYRAGSCKHLLATYLHRQLDARMLEALRQAVGETA